MMCARVGKETKFDYLNVELKVLQQKTFESSKLQNCLNICAFYMHGIWESACL